MEERKPWLQQVFLEEKVQLGCNASWSKKGGGFPKISKLRSYIIQRLHYIY